MIANEIMLVGLRLLKEITARDLVSSFEEIEIWLSTLLKPAKAQETSFLDDLLLQNILTKSEGALLIPGRLLLLVGLQYFSSSFLANLLQRKSWVAVSGWHTPSRPSLSTSLRSATGSPTKSLNARAQRRGQ